ncbi:MAG TPA: hypothetical protein DD670_08800 [Planctomycetaceae bacterium]|nr:hypothetical protein [Planctomycetaceae bacterium]
MKTILMTWLVLVALLGLSTAAAASPVVIGSATYSGNDYNLIYEDARGLVWLDYAHAGSWQNQLTWASTLGGSLTVNLDPLYETEINWSTGWRLPNSTRDTGYNITASEMGYLYYVSLGNVQGLGLQNTGPFTHLQAVNHWSNEVSSKYSGQFHAMFFAFNIGYQGEALKTEVFPALAVHPGIVTVFHPPGDTDGDGIVNDADAKTLAANWGQAGGWAEGDFNKDGVINALDAAILAANWGPGMPTEQASSATAVPEPGVLAMLTCFGLLASGRLRRSTRG